MKKERNDECNAKKNYCKWQKTFKKICEEHQLQYFMIGGGGGTLLGAVRHQGFIPWDDDMDFVMPRADYERFIQLFEEDKLQNFMPSYNLRYIKPNDTYYFPFIKLEDINTTLIDKYRSPTQKVIRFPSKSQILKNATKLLMRYKIIILEMYKIIFMVI